MTSRNAGVSAYHDFPVVQCAVIMLALVIVTVNLIVDVLVGLIDPRIRAGV